jgi:divalent metal cation (Fe/Co/Zn/Cd) transporter
MQTIDRPAIALRGRNLEVFTIAWNCLEGLIAVASGAVAGSISLVGFGIDSFIEVVSGSALLWRMNTDAEEHRRETIERVSLRVVGFCFIALAVYIAYEAAMNLWHKDVPESSIVGILLAVVSLIVMPMLSRAKRAVARDLNSAAMHADAKQTEFCTYLSAILLGGLILNALLGWWWADPVTALVMSPVIANEGREALSGKHCSDCH